MLASLLPLDYTACAENCKHMALLLSTWDAARLQLSIHEKNKAVSKLGVQARLVQSTEQASMTAAVEPWHGRLSDSELPSKSLLATKLERLFLFDWGCKMNWGCWFAWRQWFFITVIISDAEFLEAGSVMMTRK